MGKERDELYSISLKHKKAKIRELKWPKRAALEGKKLHIE